jgi:hypothetical protein
MKELQEEREALFSFSDEEKAAWSSSANRKLDHSLLDRVEQARRLSKSDETVGSLPESNMDDDDDDDDDYSSNDCSASNLTHLTKDGASVQMVDVGSKDVTRRRAVARSTLRFPPGVIEKAFRNAMDQTDLVGPKGPIFATAKIAGIMAAKCVYPRGGVSLFAPAKKKLTLPILAILLQTNKRFDSTLPPVTIRSGQC